MKQRLTGLYVIALVAVALFAAGHEGRQVSAASVLSIVQEPAGPERVERAPSIFPSALPGQLPTVFRPVAPQGLGSRQNSFAWSMAWWKGKLFVGTGRSNYCAQEATAALFVPRLPYPPLEPDVDCAPSPQDLQMRAEIWRWTPGSNQWDRVFVSPEDVPIPGHDGKFVARDIGFRSMAAFVEPDGTEALYVGGVSSMSYNLGVPSARILRTIDGGTFEPVPRTPGTFLGDAKVVSYRSMLVHDGRLFVIASRGAEGFGPIFVSGNPVLGDNAFAMAFSPDIIAFEIASYNSTVFIGTGASSYEYPPNPDLPGFSVLKASIGSSLPYTTTTVMKDGGDRYVFPSRAVASMQVFRDRLYIGTDRPAELLRINPDDSWDLIVGTPRSQSPSGAKNPLSELGVGFDNLFALHLWRMVEHEGRLYVGTMDQSTKWRWLPGLGRLAEPEMGYDLWATENGRDFTMITRSGFGDPFDVGIRTLTSTENGLFLGSANHYYGTRIRLEADSSSFVPYMGSAAPPSGTPERIPAQPGIASSNAITDSVHLEAPVIVVEARTGSALLWWEQVPNAVRYHIWRSDYATGAELGVGQYVPQVSLGGVDHEIGSVTASHYMDSTVEANRIYRYFVTAEDAGGRLSGRSNAVRSPVLLPARTIGALLAHVTGLQRMPGAPPFLTESGIKELLLTAFEAGTTGDCATAAVQVRSAASGLEPYRAAEGGWLATELQAELSVLAGRIDLCVAGVLRADEISFAP